MASRQSIADYIVEQLDAAGVTARKMFGEFGLFSEGKMVALICDDQLYVKPTAKGRSFLGDCPEGQPYPRAKPHFLIPAERWEDFRVADKVDTADGSGTSSSEGKASQVTLNGPRPQKVASPTSTDQATANRQLPRFCPIAGLRSGSA